MTDKLRSTYGGTARILVILSVVILILVFILSIPALKRFNYEWQCIACEQAMKSAKDGLVIAYLDTFDESSLKEARRTLDEVMPARPDICPNGGNVYLIRNSEGILEPLCGLHDRNVRERTRLNATYAGNQLLEERKNILEKAKEGDPEPEEIVITVNSKPLKCVYVTEEVNIRRGTSETDGFDGIVSFYGTDAEGEVNYFVYADEDYCAIWHADDGWTGDAYKS
ncbi:MAG: hypothetical protein E7219_04310 [Clostridiales bacterium]|jgi:hypothetical protein|nr:hypothetical protein [Clostridiales bacterium]